MDLSIVIPAMNEAENIAALIPEIEQAAQSLGLKYEILLMDGGSVDGTDRIAREKHATVISQKTRGYGGAISEGLAAAQGDYVLTMDADLSHDPAFLATFWNARDQGELIIGSRYVPGGTAEMPAARKLLSRILNVFFGQGLSIPWKDLSSGFRLYRTSAVKHLQLQSINFDILQEILIRGYAQGWRVMEVPIRYKPRQIGSSHAKLLRFGIAYLRTFRRMWNLRNSIQCADYDDRAHNSKIPIQRYWQRRRYSIIEDFGSNHGLTLDIGCGSSRILSSKVRPIGMDILINKLLYARKFGRPLLNASIWSLPFPDQTFDCVVCSEVIEHIDSGLKPFLEMRRILKTGGTLVLGTPDYGHLTWRMIERIYGWIVPGGYADEHITHYTFKSLKELVESLGFRVIQHKYICRSELIFQCILTNSTGNEAPSSAQIDKDKTAT